MMEIKIVLYDSVELAGFHSYYEAVLQRRHQMTALVPEQAEAAVVEPETVTTESFGEKLVEAVAEAVEIHEGRAEPARVDTVTEGAQVGGSVAVTPKDIFNQFYQTHGFASARKKLDAFGAQRFSDIKTEQLPAFLASLRGPA